MRPNGRVTNAQKVCYFLVRKAFTDQIGYLIFSWSEVFFLLGSTEKRLVLNLKGVDKPLGEAANKSLFRQKKGRE